jgi:FkbM family methyltransferase
MQPLRKPAPDRLQALADRYGTQFRADADAELRHRLAACGTLAIFGAGQNGAQVLGLLRAAGLSPACFLDDTPSKIGTENDGVPILAVDAVADLSDAVVLVSIFTPTAAFAPIGRRLEGLGAQPVSLFAVLSAVGEALPFYFVDRPQTVLDALGDLQWLHERLLDAPSRALLEAQVEFRLSLKPDVLPPWSLQRLPPPAGWDNFHMIDAGAFDGDTLIPLIASHGAQMRGAVALEPDPATFLRLEANLEPARRLAAGPVRALRAAVDRQGGTRVFANCGNPGSSFGEQGIVVDTVCIDDLACDIDPASRLYIKFDVEGAEAEALAGARAAITHRRPFLSIAAYHRPEDLWSLARLVAGMDDGYRFKLRSHGADGADLTLYAVPADAQGGSHA